MKKRVAIYGINYAPEMAGAGRFTGEIGEHFAALGHDVFVLTTPPHYPGWKAQPPHSANAWSKEVIAGATVYRSPIWLHPDMKGIRRLLAPLSFALSSAPIAIWKILTRRPDVVIVVEPTLFVAPLALICAKLVGARTVLHVQDLEVDAAFAVGHLGDGGPVRKIAAAIERGVVQSFDRVITISNKMAERIALKGVRQDRIEVIRNWVDLDLVKPVKRSDAYRTQLGLPVDAFVALYSGNIGAKQGLRLVIEAARQLEGRKDILFVVAGQGPMRAEVEAVAAECSNLKVLDFQPEARYAEFLALADVLLLPQERDTADLLLPSKLAGMLASGRRVVVTADPGTEMAEFLGQSCVFSTPGDPAELARALVAVAGEQPDKHREAERLALAKVLSKGAIIPKFTAAALFLPAEPVLAIDGLGT